MPAGEGWLTDGEREHLASFTVAKRAEEWRLRRWAGKVAVVAWLPSSPDAASIEIANEADGSPFAYHRHDASRLPVSLSLSDRGGSAVALVGGDGLELGCDIELVEARSDAFVRDWFDEEEQAVVARAASPALAANLVWSAKETALKVLREGLRRPLRSVSVRVTVDQPGDGWRPWTAELAEGGRIEGWWHALDEFVVTVASRPPSPPPRPLSPSGVREPL